MDSTQEPTRRDFLTLTATAMGVLGVGAGSWVLVDSLNPAADTLAKTKIIDLVSIKPGQRAFEVSHGQLLFIYRRTQEDIQQLRAEDWRKLRYPESDESRVKDGHDEWLVVFGFCTRVGCVLLGNREDQPRGYWGGWMCPCCGSRYDKSGRVRQGPAPKNLIVPNYEFVTDTRIRIYDVQAMP